MARNTKISFGGKMWGKGSSFGSSLFGKNGSGNLLVTYHNKEDKEIVRNVMSNATELSLGLIGSMGKKVKRNAWLKLKEGEYWVDGLGRSFASEELNKKCKASLERLYRRAVLDKFSYGGSGVNKWLPLSRRTLKRRLWSGGRSSPLLESGVLKEEAGNSFFVDNFSLFDKAKFSGDILSFSNFDVSIEWNNNRKIGNTYLPWHKPGSFATFSQLVKHQNRWRRIPLTTGKSGDAIGGGRLFSGDRKTLKFADVLGGEFFHYVWKPFTKVWLQEFSKILRSEKSIRTKGGKGEYAGSGSDLKYLAKELHKKNEKLIQDSMKDVGRIKEPVLLANKMNDYSGVVERCKKALNGS
jgi:hypothetical protein